MDGILRHHGGIAAGANNRGPKQYRTPFMSKISYSCLLGSVLLVPLVLLAACDRESEQAVGERSPVIRPAKTIVIEAGMQSLQVSYPASVVPSQEVDLSFRVSGKLVELPIRASMTVKRGDVLARLDVRDFEAEVVQVDSRLDQARAELNAITSGARAEDIASLKAAVVANEARVRAAREQLDRSRKLHKRGIVADVRLQKDETELHVAEAELRSRMQELAKGQAGGRTEEIDAQRAVIRRFEGQLQSARDNLSDATLRAPFDGVIARRSVENFANVKAQEPIATLQQLQSIDLVFDVPGPDVVRFGGRNATITTVTLDALSDREFEASLKEFSTQADPTTQTFRGRVSIPNPGGVTILPGMTGWIIVTVPETDTTTIIVPLSALGAGPDGSPFVWIVAPSDNTVVKRPVEIGEATRDGIVVSEGLSAGDVIVTAGVSHLQFGMVVKPITAIGE